MSKRCRHRFTSNSLGIARRLIVREKFAAARRLLTRLVRQNCPDAAYLMGCFWFHADSDMHSGEAGYWFQLAAEQGHPDAMYWLATSDFEHGGWSNIVKGSAKLILLRRAARLGSPDAQRDLGCVYAWGEHLPYRPELTRYWYSRASNQGHLGARLDLASMCIDGEGGSIDFAWAERLYQSVAVKGATAAPDSMFACQSLAKLYQGEFAADYADVNLGRHYADEAERLDSAGIQGAWDVLYYHRSRANMRSGLAAAKGLRFDPVIERHRRALRSEPSRSWLEQ